MAEGTVIHQWDEANDEGSKECICPILTSKKCGESRRFRMETIGAIVISLLVLCSPRFLQHLVSSRGLLLSLAISGDENTSALKVPALLAVTDNLPNRGASCTFIALS